MYLCIHFKITYPGKNLDKTTEAELICYPPLYPGHHPADGCHAIKRVSPSVCVCVCVPVHQCVSTPQNMCLAFHT